MADDKKTIDKLTPEQEALLPVYKEKWIKIAMNGDPLDEMAARIGIRKAYEAADLTAPRIFFKFKSPIGAAIGTDFIFKTAIEDEKYKNRDWKEVWDDKHETCTLPELQEMADKYLESVQADINAYNFSKFDKSKISNFINISIYGHHEAGWLAFYDYMLNVMGIQECSKLEGLMEIAKSCGWWIPMQDIAVMQDRCKEIHFDAQERLHNEDGPAISYADGFCIYSIGGNIVDEQIVMRPETQTVEQINKETNEEIRRIRINRFGWDNYLQQSGATVLEVAMDCEGYKQSLMKTSNNMTVLCVACPSTGRVYSLEVASEITTCQAAQDYLAGFDVSTQGIFTEEEMRSNKNLLKGVFEGQS